MNAMDNEDFATLRSRLLDDSILWLAIVAIPGIIISLSRVLIVGPRMLSPLWLLGPVSVLVIWTIWFTRRRTSYRTRILVFLGALWLPSFVGMISFGPIALGGLHLVMLGFLAVLFLDGYLAWGIIAGNTLCLVLIGIAATQHWLTFDLDYQSYAYHPITWLHTVWNLTTYALILAFIGWRMMQGLLHSEERLRQKKDAAQRYLDTVQTVMVSLNSLGQVTMINRQGCELLGYEESELLGCNWFEHCLPQPVGKETVYPAFRRLLAGELQSVKYFENPVLCRDGTERLVAWHNAYLNDENGKIVGCLSSGEDITERKQAENDLIAAREAAETASRAKSVFLASMSHELRTPLNAIVGFAQMLDMGIPGSLNPAQKEAMEHILSGSRHLLELINEILDLGRIESGRLELAIETLALAPLIEEAASLLRPAAAARGIIIQHFCPDELHIRADRSRVRQVLFNLLSNAVKYNSEGGKVSCSCMVSENVVRISVADTGHGISEQHCADIFQPFQRLDADKNTIEGTGIGLAICKSLVTAMDGRIGFNSELGIGSNFWFELPLERLDDKSATDARAGLLAASSQPCGACRGRVLYVEDNPVNINVMKHIFRMLPGVELITAQSAEDGLIILHDIRPSLILMDINLPGISGHDALKLIKADPRTAAIPVIAVSAAAMPSDVKAGLEAGFVTYLTKPFNVPSLLEQIRTLLDKGETSA
ncbi:MAG: ATP-binding protein [Methylobacter sp.]